MQYEDAHALCRSWMYIQNVIAYTGACKMGIEDLSVLSYQLPVL